MKTINKEISVYAKQRKFLESKALWRAFAAGLGSGKSHCGSLDMIRRAKPGRLYMVTAPTYTMLSDATFRSLTGLAQQLEVIGPGDIKLSPPQSVKLRNSAEILFRSTDDPEHLRGANLSGVWMDEASLSKQEAYDILIGRLREGGEQGWLSATFTPKGKTHWTYKKFGTGQPDTELIHAKSEENPFLPKGFVAKLRGQYTARQAKQELGGLFVDDGGNHYFPNGWPRYVDVGDAYQVRAGDRWHHIRKADCSRLLALDWAMGKPKKGVKPEMVGELGGDCTAFVVADLTIDGLLLLVDCVAERIPLGSNAPRLAELCRRWGPMVVAGDNDNLSETMLLETRRFSDIPTVTCLPLGGRNKLARSQAILVRAERGQVLLPQDEGPWVEVLSDQLASFTGADGEPDDIADCASILGRLADAWVPGEVGGDNYPALGAGEFGALGYESRYGGDNYVPVQGGFNRDLYGVNGRRS